MTTSPKLIALCLLALACSCVFDESGLVMPDAGGDARTDATVDPDGQVDTDAGCVDACALGDPARCSTDHRALEVCSTGSLGCTLWSTDITCASEEQCIDAAAGLPAQCAPCATCVEGAALCVAGAPALREVCVTDGQTGCTYWETRDCGSGALCSDPGNGDPAVCESCVECTALEPACAGTGLGIDRCALEPGTGCRAWESFDCPAGWSCPPGVAATLCSQDGTAGLTTEGSAAYPTLTFGNTATGTGPVLGNYLVADKYVTPVPLTALQIKTYGTDGGSIKISVYDHDAANDLPGNRLFGEVTGSLATDAWTTLNLPARAHLPAGTYWILFNASANDGVTYSAQTGGARVWKSTAYSNPLPASGGGGWTRSGARDCTHLVGIALRGYAKASRIAITEANVAVNKLDFFTHEAGGFRLAIYDGSASPVSRLWESGPMAAAAGVWTAVPIAAGLPASLTLGPGTYWLAWQWDALGSGPSYTAGSDGDGFFVPLPYGPFPVTWPGGASSGEVWSLFASTTAFAPPIGW